MAVFTKESVKQDAKDGNSVLAKKPEPKTDVPIQLPVAPQASVVPLVTQPNPDIPVLPIPAKSGKVTSAIEPSEGQTQLEQPSMMPAAPNRNSPSQQQPPSILTSANDSSEPQQQIMELSAPTATDLLPENVPVSASPPIPEIFSGQILRKPPSGVAQPADIKQPMPQVADQADAARSVTDDNTQNDQSRDLESSIRVPADSTADFIATQLLEPRGAGQTVDSLPPQPKIRSPHTDPDTKFQVRPDSLQPETLSRTTSSHSSNPSEPAPAVPAPVILDPALKIAQSNPPAHDAPPVLPIASPFKSPSGNVKARITGVIPSDNQTAVKTPAAQNAHAAAPDPSVPDAKIPPSKPVDATGITSNSKTNDIPNDVTALAGTVAASAAGQNHSQPAGAQSSSTRNEQGTQPAPLADPPTESTPTTGVQLTRAVENVSTAEMHIGLRTQAFGSVEVHTTVRDAQLGMAVSNEKGDLKSFLAPEVPVLQSVLHQHDLRFDGIRFVNHTLETAAQFSGNHHQPFSERRLARSYTAGDAAGEPVTDDTDLVAAFDAPARISIHA